MIEHLIGQCFKKTLTGLIVNVAGVGYGVEILPPALLQIQEGQTLSLWIYTQVSEDSLRLFGFTTYEERQLFGMLIGVSRIGPKLAMAILASIGSKRLMSVIEQEDSRALAEVPGIGSQSAKKFILELKSKLERLVKTGVISLNPQGASKVDGAIVKDQHVQDHHVQLQILWSDLRLALENFGYKEREITPVIRRLAQMMQGDLIVHKISLEDLVRKALTEIVRRPESGRLYEEELF